MESWNFIFMRKRCGSSQRAGPGGGWDYCSLVNFSRTSALDHFFACSRDFSKFAGKITDSQRFFRCHITASEYFQTGMAEENIPFTVVEFSSEDPVSASRPLHGVFYCHHWFAIWDLGIWYYFEGLSCGKCCNGGWLARCGCRIAAGICCPPGEYCTLLVDCSIDWLIHLIGWLVHWPIDWLIDWSIDWLVCSISSRAFISVGSAGWNTFNQHYKQFHGYPGSHGMEKGRGRLGRAVHCGQIVSHDAAGCSWKEERQRRSGSRVESWAVGCRMGKSEAALPAAV